MFSNSWNISIFVTVILQILYHSIKSSYVTNGTCRICPKMSLRSDHLQFFLYNIYSDLNLKIRSPSPLKNNTFVFFSSLTAHWPYPGCTLKVTSQTIVTYFLEMRNANRNATRQYTYFQKKGESMRSKSFPFYDFFALQIIAKNHGFWPRATYHIKVLEKNRFVKVCFKGGLRKGV